MCIQKVEDVRRPKLAFGQGTAQPLQERFAREVLLFETGRPDSSVDRMASLPCCQAALNSSLSINTGLMGSLSQAREVRWDRLSCD